MAAGQWRWLRGSPWEPLTLPGVGRCCGAKCQPTHTPQASPLLLSFETWQAGAKSHISPKRTNIYFIFDSQYQKIKNHINYLPSDENITIFPFFAEPVMQHLLIYMGHFRAYMLTQKIVFSDVYKAFHKFVPSLPKSHTVLYVIIRLYTCEQWQYRTSHVILHTFVWQGYLKRCAATPATLTAGIWVCKYKETHYLLVKQQ